jgi:predicted aspartyl protease
VPFLLLCIVFFLITGSLNAATAPTIPFSRTDGLIRVKVEAPSGFPLIFVLDSGASASVIDLSTARRLGYTLGSRKMVRTVGALCPSYRVNDHGLRLVGEALPASLLAMDLRHASGGCAKKIDGLLGTDFLRGHIVQIDFASGIIRFVASNAPVGGCLPLRMRNGAPCVEIRVDDSPARPVRLDTGFNGGLRWILGKLKPASAKAASVALSRANATASTQITLGALELSGVQTVFHSHAIFPGEAGLLGTGVLFRFRTISIDVSGGRLFLEPR